ncbi:methionyl-tRNA formyltransferase [Marininema halotolerans]|uniref:Methionyl-tRNA formyltransferase n=1 Tax=Marininema halotolerans TaxID=1155944 RepID=A0A1I6QEQ3_9BACL|nr:methionyl-tRNA formyltransferase [Marininema halotolerans]SFS50983.1 methionyl-tRNA formyltransferase [Marininema halotolerans]
MDQIRIVFMGTPDFAVPSLEGLMKAGGNVVAVVTQPDRPRGRKRELTPSPVKRAAEQWNLPVLQPEKLREPDALAELLAYKPDLIVTAAYGQLLPKALLDVPRLGCINVHASLLPKYRGGAPIHHALINGEKETGITIMYMVEALDAGDILSQERMVIDESDDVGTLHDKLSHVGATLLLKTIPQLLSNEIKARPQDPQEVTYSPNIRREDEAIQWEKSAKQIADQVRGLRPWPVAYTLWDAKPLKIWRAHVLDESCTESPGTVLRSGPNGIAVATGKGVLVITELQPAGKKAMTAEQLLRGRSIERGTRLGDG